MISYCFTVLDQNHYISNRAMTIRYYHFIWEGISTVFKQVNHWDYSHSFLLGE